MEDFLLNFRGNLDGKFFAAAELGNYYGYDDFILGAMPIMRELMKQKGCRELVTPRSLDVLPKRNFSILEEWCRLLNQKVDSVG